MKVTIKTAKGEMVEGTLQTIQPEGLELWAFAGSGGDTNDNKKADVTYMGGFRLPLFGHVPVGPRTVDVPLDEVLQLAGVAADAIAPVPGVGVVASAGIRSLAALVRAVFAQLRR